jgi:hypothetical protein
MSGNHDFQPEKRVVGKNGRVTEGLETRLPGKDLTPG